jgi:hypothetical protein
VSVGMMLSPSIRFKTAVTVVTTRRRNRRLLQ